MMDFTKTFKGVGMQWNRKTVFMAGILGPGLGSLGAALIAPGDITSDLVVTEVTFLGSGNLPMSGSVLSLAKGPPS